MTCVCVATVNVCEFFAVSDGTLSAPHGSPAPVVPALNQDRARSHT